MASENSTSGGDRKYNSKPSNYYVDYTKKRSEYKRHHTRPYDQNNSTSSKFSSVPEVSFGQRGFLITSTSFNEVKCYIEMRNILEEYYNHIYKTKTTEDQNSDDKKNDCKQERIQEDDLESELKQLKLSRPFKQVKTKCKQVIFLTILPSFTEIEPNVIVDRFFDDILEKKQLRTFKTFKIYPVFDTFRINKSCVKAAVDTYLCKYHLEDDSKKYFVELQTRGNFKLDCDQKLLLINAVAEQVTQAKPNWVVNRDGCDMIFSLTVLKSVCCLSVLGKYFERAKYNVIEFSKKIGLDVQDDNVKDELDKSQQLDEKIE